MEMDVVVVCDNCTRSWYVPVKFIGNKRENEYNCNRRQSQSLDALSFVASVRSGLSHSLSRELFKRKMFENYDANLSNMFAGW